MDVERKLDPKIALRNRSIDEFHVNSLTKKKCLGF